MGTLYAGCARAVHAAIVLFVLLTFGTAIATAQTPPPAIGRVGVRVTSAAASSTLEGSLFALDSTGQPVQEFDLLPASATIPQTTPR